MAQLQQAHALVAALRVVHYDAVRAMLRLDNYQLGIDENFFFIPGRPYRPPLALANFPRNFRDLMRLTVPRANACIASYGIVIRQGARIHEKRWAIGRYIGVRFPSSRQKGENYKRCTCSPRMRCRFGAIRGSDLASAMSSTWMADYLRRIGASKECITRAEERHKEYRAFCQTTKRLPEEIISGFSCDWENWKHVLSHLKAPLYYNLTDMDMEMKCMYGITPPIRPITYMKDSHDDDYIFEADGKYFFWAPGIEDLWLLNDVEDDETALDGWAMGKKMKLEPADDGHKKLYKLECEQMELARKLVAPQVCSLY